MSVLQSITEGDTKETDRAMEEYLRTHCQSEKKSIWHKIDCYMLKRFGTVEIPVTQEDFEYVLKTPAGRLALFLFQCFLAAVLIPIFLKILM